MQNLFIHFVTALVAKIYPHIFLSSMRFYFSGTHPSDVLKMPSLTRGTGNGYWLDASTGGMVWRPTPSGDTIDMQKDQIDDYAPVCLTNNSANGSDNTNERGQQRYVGEYSNIPTDYAEVSSFGKTGSEYGVGGGRKSNWQQISIL
uniref:Uncharacterized protein n=1 Tax=Glossina palpalis gambiensis TaxID=67801 RepID=A0A1B0B0W9_9MUSC